MCWCTPEIRTPFCGKPTCVPPVERHRMEQKPSIGRMVHYQNDNGITFPAVITEIRNQETLECLLFVIEPFANAPFKSRPFSEEPKPGHWNWPPKV